MSTPLEQPVIHTSSAASSPLDAGFEELPPTSGSILIEVLTQLAERKWTILKITGAAVLIGLALCFLLPVRYTATTEILPPHQTQSAADLFVGQLASSNLGALAGMAGGGLGLKSPDDLYIGLIKSRPVLDALIERFNLQREYHSRDLTGARQKLGDNTSVVSEKSGLISISVTDRNKAQAAAMANDYTRQLRALTQSLAVTEASQRRLFYEQQLKSAKQDLDKAAFAFQQVEQKKGLVQPDAQAKALIGSLATLRAQAAAKQVQLQAIRSYSTEHNPEVALAENQLASLQAQIQQLERRKNPSGPSDFSIEDVPSAGMDYLSAEHELRYRQTLFDLLIKQYDAARLDEAKEAAVIQVVEPAIPPDRKSSPKRAMLMAVFTVGGCFIACILALLQWWRELLQEDPVVAGQLHGLRSALSLRSARR